MRSGVSGRDLSNSRAFVRWLIASRWPSVRRLLPCLLPVGNGLFDQSRFGVVMSQEFGLRLLQVRELPFQNAGNLLMQLLPSALE